MVKQLSLANAGFNKGPEGSLAAISNYYPREQGNVRFQDKDYAQPSKNSRDRYRNESRRPSRYRQQNRSHNKGERNRSRSHSRGREHYSHRSHSREVQRNNHRDRSLSQNRYERGRPRSSSRERGNNNNRSRSNSLRRNDSPHPNKDSVNKQNIECHRCGNKGHIAAECYTKNPKKQNRKN